MSVDTLANTAWLIKSSPTVSSAISSKSITFASAGSSSTSYTAFRIYNSSIRFYYSSSYTSVYSSSSWSNKYYRVVRITGGTDVADSTLITWFQNNATQIPISLANTSWTINDEPDVSSSLGIFYVNFNSPPLFSTSHTRMRIGYSSRYLQYYNSSGYTSVYDASSEEWSQGVGYKGVDFVDGTSIADITLLGWLALNATMEEPTVTLTFNMNGHGGSIASQTLDVGGVPTQPPNPSETGWVFGGWYTSNEFTTEFNFANGVTTNTTAYAKWTEAEDPNMYIGVGGKAQKITDMYIGVGGKARKVVKGYIGVLGKAQSFFNNTTPAPVNSYYVVKAATVDYKFVQCANNTSDTYYFSGTSSFDNTWLRSNNYGVDRQSAMSYLSLDIQTPCHLTIDVLDYLNEYDYDYGTVGMLDTVLDASAQYSSTSSTVKWTGYNNHIRGGETIDFGTVAVGEHYIYIRYLKDSSEAVANDRLYFRVKFDGVVTTPTTVI